MGDCGITALHIGPILASRWIFSEELSFASENLPNWMNNDDDIVVVMMMIMSLFIIHHHHYHSIIIIRKVMIVERIIKIVVLMGTG